MKKKLILFRHGKSDRDMEYESDHERDLARRGMKAAKVMGRVLQKSGQFPDLVVTSSAVRARNTTEIAAQKGEWNCPIKVSETLYEADPLIVLGLIKKTGDDVETLLLTGHEPTWSELIGLFIGETSNIRVPTCGMARIDFEVDSWAEVEFEKGELIWLLQPKFFTKGTFKGLKKDPVE